MKNASILLGVKMKKMSSLSVVISILVLVAWVHPDRVEAEESGKSSAWFERIKVSGDLRLRHDTQWREEKNGATEYARHRERFRLRIGAKAKTSENTEVGFRLATGSGFQNTTNQSADAHARGKGIFVDKAYATWKATDMLTITGGKHSRPLFTSSLVWDSDVNPEGLSESYSIPITDTAELFANLGQWFIEELDLKDAGDSDPSLLVYQIGSTVSPSKKTKLQFAVTYYDFVHIEEFRHGDLSDKTSFIGYNHKYGQQMIFDRDEKLLNEFKCLEFGFKLSMKDILPAPVSLFGSYIANLESDIGRLIANGVDPGDSDPNDLSVYGGSDRDSGWQVGFSVGSKKSQGDRYMKYFYQELEDYAFPAVFVDSDFHGGGTNNKGHYIQGLYLLTDKIQAKVTGFLTQRESESKDGQKDENRIQLDVILKF